MDNPIVIQTIINAPIEKVWEAYTNPSCVEQWNFASEDWHCPKAENTLSVGGTFNYRMEAKNGSFGFDLKGKFTEIDYLKSIAYDLEDGRKVKLDFVTNEDGSILVTESFEAENQNSRELQQQGWQMILDNFKKFVEQQ